ncbi:MAG: 2OG-Fe(II) oxygenase [Caulobacteraceae bacterium]|nr:2OG-Fe(II) oxygenase [Caulobacter sp.]
MSDTSAANVEPSPVIEPPRASGRRFRQLSPGDPFPWLGQRVASKPHFAFDTMAGRYQLFGFFMAACDADARAAIEAVHRSRQLFDDRHCSFIGVSITRADEGCGLRDLLPGIRFAWDFDHALSRACGAVPEDSDPEAPTPCRRCWVLVDPSLHVLRVFPFGGPEASAAVMQAVAQLPEPDLFGGVRRPAPVLVLPNVFEPELCAALIAAYDAAGGEESGVHRNGQGVIDAGFKRRKDHTVTDAAMLAQINGRITRRVLPEIEKLFFMRAQYIERHIVGCYAALDGGHFGPHRDNRQGLTAHRRFAVSINLNAGFGGGEVVFPEYNLQGCKAPPGWAVVFPCAILHQVRPVTSGARYAFLPFVYDEGGRAIREAELARLAAEAAASRLSPAG